MRERMTVRRSIATVTLVGLIGVLSACVGIPSSGSVVVGPEINKGVTGEFQFIPAGPVAGASQEQILRGFISAFTGPDGDYKVARQFLSSGFASTWDARNSVLVRTGGFTFASIDSTRMSYSMKTMAAVDATGGYTESTIPAPQTLTFTFVKENKQWRISDAPKGVVLAEGTFRSIFSPQTLYFLDPTLQSLVPDLRWFPAGTAATRIVNALLVGPPPWLQQGAVTSVFPAGTQLSPPRVVTVESGVAKVDLSNEALGAKDKERQLMRLQLALSLSGVPSIRSVSITVNGSPYPISDPGSDLPELHPQVDARPVVLQDGGFGYSAGGTVAALDALSDEIVRVKPTAATVGSNGTVAAVLGEGGVYAVRKGRAPALLVDKRPGLIAPTLDEYGYIWSVPQANPTAIMVFDLDGKPHTIAQTLPADARVVSLAVSRDGARMALLLATDAGPRLMVAAILRDPGQRYVPTTLGDPILDVVVDSGSAIGATWVDELSVATLTAVGGTTSVEQFQIGGMRSTLGRPGDAIEIVGGNGIDSLRVLGADHVVQLPRGSSWSSTEVKVDFIATQR